MREVLALFIGYLLGSVLPADLLGRSRGIDIRGIGTRNPGTTNALRELGLVPGVITGAYDVSVGLVSMYVASSLGLALGWTYLAGVAAIVGHLYPVFFGFHGGQGMAAATGILVYEMGVALANGWLTVFGIGVLAALAIAVFALTRSATVVGVVVAPLLALEILLAGPGWEFAAFMTALAGFIWATQLSIALHERLFRLVAPARGRVPKSKAPSH
jgi:glycerol-3-phosphate acyltransferase PlsY